MLPSAGIIHTYTIRGVVTYGDVNTEFTGVSAVRMFEKPSGNGYAVWNSVNASNIDSVTYVEYYLDGRYGTAQIQGDDCISVDLSSVHANCTTWVQVDTLVYELRCTVSGIDMTAKLYAQSTDPNSPARMTTSMNMSYLGTISGVQEFLHKTESLPFPNVVPC